MNDFTLLLPEIMLAALVLLVLGASIPPSGRHQHLLGYVSAFGLAGLAAFSLDFLWGESGSFHGGLLRIDRYALFFKGFFLVLGVRGGTVQRRVCARTPGAPG